MNYGISCDPGSKNASPAVWCRRLKCGACTCNSTGKRHSRSWPESAIQNRPQRRRAADPAQHVPHRRFFCPSCAALQCRRPACTGSRTAPAGFSSGTPGFTPKTAPRFLAWRVFTSYAGGVRAARWCAGRSVPPKCGAQNAKRATDCGGVPQFFMERKAPFAAQRSLSDVAANIWKSAMTPNMHKTGTSVYTLRVPACFCADSGGSTAQKRLDGRPSAAEHVAAFNCVRACAAKQSHYTRFSLSIPEKTAKFGKIRVVRMQKPFCAEKNHLCRVFRCRRGQCVSCVLRRSVLCSGAGLCHAQYAIYVPCRRSYQPFRKEHRDIAAEGGTTGGQICSAPVAV